jgi:hypothetical protein
MAWMSLRAGWGMMTNSDAMVKFFAPFGTTPLLRQLLGAIGFFGCLMMFFPQTFVWGSWLNLGVIMFLLVQFTFLHDWKGLLGESWVVVLAFVILALGHPLAPRVAENA